MKHRQLLIVAALYGLITNLGHAQGTAFTYQGRLNDGGTPANGSYDLRFILYDSSVGGSQQGPILTNAATAASNGLFTVTLDFSNQFSGPARWLDIAVRTNDGGSFFPLTPRQALTPAPYAITAGNVISGGLPAGSYSNAVNFGNAANQFTGSFTGDGLNVSNVNAATLNGFSERSFWNIGGNTGTSPGANFLGTADNQPLVIRANNLQVMQLGYASNSASGYSPNVIGGNALNSVAAGVVGATIGGGGAAPGFFTGPNSVTADFGTVVGGSTCSAQGYGAIAGGSLSTASGIASVALGDFCKASGDYSVAMGELSMATGTNSTAFGYFSKATNNYATAMGYQSVAGGYGDTAMGYTTTASGGGATAMGAYSQAIAAYSTAMGHSDATGFGSTAMGDSSATNTYSTAFGAATADGVGSTAMGYLTTASGTYSVAMGYGCVASADYSFAGGNLANAVDPGSFVWGDDQDAFFTSTGPNQFLIRAAGGVGIGTAAPETALHIADPSGITLGQSATGGGYTALRIDLSAVSGGYAELQAISSSGSSYGNLILQANAGYVGIGKNNPATPLDVNGTVSATSFNTTSDRNAKENFAAVSPTDVLAKIAALPISEWSFKTDPADQRHVGPMAQDFHAAFGLNGDDDKHISVVDEGGVALAAIQGLNQKLEQKEMEITELKERLEKLEQIINPKNGGRQ